MAVNEYSPNGGDRTLLIYRSREDKQPFMLDVVIEAETARGVDVSRFPTETGAQGVDHARKRPEQYRFRGMFVNEPTDDGAAQKRSDATIVPDSSAPLTIAERLLGRDFRDPLISSRILGPQVDEKRSVNLLKELIAIMEAREPVLIVTESLDIDDFLLTEITERPVGKNAIEVSGSFVRARFASRYSVELKPVPRPTPPQKPHASSKTEVGPKGKTEAPVVEKEKATSILLKAAQLVGF